MIRLQEGSYSNQGRAEVYCNGQWGTICDDGFSSNEAKIVCRQLGYNSFYNYNHLNYMLVILLLAKCFNVCIVSDLVILVNQFGV